MADLLQGVREGAVEGSGDIPQDFKMPTREELLEALEKMTGLSEEDKQKLLESVVAQSGEPGAGQGFAGLPTDSIGVKSAPLEIVWVLTLVSLVILVLVFFGYKLYKSLVDRERRREEKKRQKLQKKKK